MKKFCPPHKKPINPQWTSEELLNAIKWKADDLSFAEIGRLLNKTRNAVAGKIYRYHHRKPGKEIKLDTISRGNLSMIDGWFV